MAAYNEFQLAAMEAGRALGKAIFGSDDIRARVSSHAALSLLSGAECSWVPLFREGSEAVRQYERVWEREKTYRGRREANHELR